MPSRFSRTRFRQHWQHPTWTFSKKKRPERTPDGRGDALFSAMQSLIICPPVRALVAPPDGGRGPSRTVVSFSSSASQTSVHLGILRVNVDNSRRRRLMIVPRRSCDRRNPAGGIEITEYRGTLWRVDWRKTRIISYVIFVIAEVVGFSALLALRGY